VGDQELGAGAPRGVQLAGHERAVRPALAAHVPGRAQSDAPALFVDTLVGSLLLLALTALTEWSTARPLALANGEAILASHYACGVARHAEAVQPMGTLPALRQRWRERQDSVQTLQAQASHQADLIGAVTRSTRISLQSMALALGTWLVLRGELGAVAMSPGSSVAILRGVNLVPEPGDIIGVIGPMASGKSSLARLLVGKWAPAMGSVRLDGADIAPCARG
jgi:ABC-type protease/lipase transport system fused ATPase/permease subunit